MPAAKPALQEEACVPDLVAAKSNLNAIGPIGPHLVTQSPVARTELHSVSPPSPIKAANFQPRTPVITGEVTYRGTIAVDGTICGQLGVAASGLTIKQRLRHAAGDPELNGEISFKDLLRINGHIAGKVFSHKGTLIIDPSARVEAEIDVAVCVVSGVVEGDIVGHQRVEVTPGAVVKGNIATRALSIKPGAVFQGDCRMLKEQNGES